MATIPGVVRLPDLTQNSIQGNLVFDYALPAGDLTLRLYDVGFGGEDTWLGETKSDAQGGYSFSYKPPASNGSKVKQGGWQQQTLV
jgi:hypothetical protein